VEETNDLLSLLYRRTGQITVRRMGMELGNIPRFKHKARKAFGQLIRVFRMSCRETDVEKEVKATI